ncbi:hypothetical protein DPEC_G00198360 [Dallia pectoralis]|uniref:Uncharacterized protein n=1 Tax=Dallia pectoralis TaxID=75939 RepID=A0ACC2G7U3_DALPE|nr:hypothetical protein DPEC_G00198360 [Dallia pectoralis]
MSKSDIANLFLPRGPKCGSPALTEQVTGRQRRFRLARRVRQNSEKEWECMDTATPEGIMSALLSTYTEEFRSPGRGEPNRLRPSSVHRRNNPHPRPDFLLPRKVETTHRTTQDRVVFQAAAHENNGRTLFPPVKHLSFQHDPGWKPKLHQTRPFTQFQPLLKHTQRKYSDPNYIKGLQNDSLPAVRHLPTQARNWRSISNTRLDSCGGYSCFNVVKPSQAGHYIIHPEFMSESVH